MKKLAVLAVIVLGSLVSCEKPEIADNENINQEEFATGRGGSLNSAGSGDGDVDMD